MAPQQGITGETTDHAMRRTRPPRSAAPQRAESRSTRLACLSPREHEVFDALVLGRMNKQIAAELGTGERTVKAHRASVMRKLGVHSTADLVRMDLDAHASEDVGEAKLP